MLVALINFGVKNQVPQVSFKIVVGDLMSFFSHEFADIILFVIGYFRIYISYYGAQSFTLHINRTSLPSYSITWSSPHITSKDGDILHLSRHLLLIVGADFTSHDSVFKDATY